MNKPVLFTAEILKQTDEAAFYRLQKIAALYHRGLLTENDAISRVLEAIRIPAAYLPKVPDHIPVPDKTYTHTYNHASTCLIGFVCKDDGGLTNDPAPIGKDFILTSDLGLRAFVKITEVQKSCYLADGYIEGYTPKERKKPQITIFTDDRGTITHLGIWEHMDDDLSAFLDYPLWQPYFEWKREFDAWLHAALWGLLVEAGSVEPTPFG